MLKETPHDENSLYTETACRQSADEAELYYVRDTDPGILRKRCGKGFMYLSPQNERVEDEETLERIRLLAIPPAYTSVWICPLPNGHLQATGRDEKRRKQYRYHPKWELVRNATKFAQMAAFADALPAIRARVDADMRKPGLPRERVLATLVRLMDTSHIRIGNAEYAKENKTYGLTTLRKKHVHVEGSHIELEFVGKSGKKWKLDMKDRRIANVIKRCEDLPGYELFKYIDEQGNNQPVTSQEVNDYLREISGKPFTAKDFRTWAATENAILHLTQSPRPAKTREAKRHLNTIIKNIAADLGHTPAICRSHYIHPQVLKAYDDDALHGWYHSRQFDNDHALISAFLKEYAE